MFAGCRTRRKGHALHENIEEITVLVQGVQAGFHHIARTTSIDFELERENVSLLRKPEAACAMATIGTVGDIRGGVAISFDAPGFSEAVEKFSHGMLVGAGNDDAMALSCIGEMANMVSGQLATFAHEKGYRLDVTPPNVFAGERVVQVYPDNVKWIYIPYRLKSGHVFLSIQIDEKSVKSAGVRV